MQYPFKKMQSLGNDFVVLDGVCNNIQMTPSLAKRMADRHFGIGCDQILIAQRAESDATNINGGASGFMYRIFNSDGSEVGQCGNGARCFARFLIDQGLTNEREIHVETQTRPMVLYVNEDGSVTVNMGCPLFEPEQVPFDAPTESVSEKHTYSLNVGGRDLDVFVLSVGNPHCVYSVEDVTTDDVLELGPLIQSHDRFPENVNAGFMQIVSKNHIRLRVYERGVGETLGCGSGACAAVASGIRAGLLDCEVKVSLSGGDAWVKWEGEENSPIFLTGPAHTVFSGTFDV